MARRLGNISRETIPLLILFVAQQKPSRGGLWHPILMQFYSGPLMQLLSGVDKLELLKRLDRIFTDHPVYGSRRLQVALLREGISVGRRRVRRLMKKLGLWAVRPKRNTGKRHPEHKVYPYLLRGKTIDQPNQVWAADVTYIPMQQGFLYLVAIIDWATRRVLSWRLSNTLTAGFCVEALSEALARFGKPGIFNTDQGAQFTSEEFT